MNAKKLNHNILAEGEATGHAHRATGSDMSLWDHGNDLFVLSAPEGSIVVHDEHKPIELPPGKYERHIVREYDHFAEEARAVRD